MPGFGNVVVVYNILPEVAERMQEALSQIVRKTAVDLQAMAQTTAPVGPTGFLKNSIYVVTDEKSTYNDISATPAAGSYALPKVERPEKNHAVVAVAANYATYVEYGTVHMAARPFLTPATEVMRPEFLRALEMLEAKLAEEGV